MMVSNFSQSLLHDRRLSLNHSGIQGSNYAPLTIRDVFIVARRLPTKPGTLQKASVDSAAVSSIFSTRMSHPHIERKPVEMVFG
jgi:hypothetical protein